MENDKKVGVGVGVMFVKGNTVLLGKRGNKSKEGGSWSMPGGKMEYGESFEDTAKREVYEETGIKIRDLEIMCLNNDRAKDVHFVTIGVIAKSWEGEPKTIEPDKNSDWQWFDLDKLPSPMFFPSAKIIENYKKKSFYIPQ